MDLHVPLGFEFATASDMSRPAAAYWQDINVFCHDADFIMVCMALVYERLYSAPRYGICGILHHHILTQALSVLYLRRKYHLGPIRIVWYLARYHGIKISDAGVSRILKRNGP